jgi:hypothetical protein
MGRIMSADNRGRAAALENAAHRAAPHLSLARLIWISYARKRVRLSGVEAIAPLATKLFSASKLTAPCARDVSRSWQLRRLPRLRRAS